MEGRGITMTRHIKITLIVLGILILMLTTAFATYRFIMCHQHLERGDNGTIYSTVFGHTDEYYVEEDQTVRIMNELKDAFNESSLADDYTITREDPYTISINL